jgi:hypothetical protein
VILALLEFILVVYHGEWVKMALFITGLFASAVALLYLVIMHLGWYVNPALVSGLAVLIKVLHWLFGRAEEAVKRQ